MTPGAGVRFVVGGAVVVSSGLLVACGSDTTSGSTDSGAGSGGIDSGTSTGGTANGGGASGGKAGGGTGAATSGGSSGRGSGGRGDGGATSGGATSGGSGSGGTDAGAGGTTSGGATSGGSGSGGTDAGAGGTTSGGATSGGTTSGGAGSGSGGVLAVEGGVDAGIDSSLSDSGADANDSSLSDSGADAALPQCPVPFADGDIWDKSVNFYASFTPLVVGPNGRLYSGFYRGYAFSDDDGQTWRVKDLSALIPAKKPWPYPAVSADGNSVWLYLQGFGTLVSRNAGKSFATVSTLSSLAPFTSGRVLVSPYHDQHVLAYASREDSVASLAGSLYRSNDGGNTWTKLDGAIATAGANGANWAAFDPATTDHFWIADMPEGVLETKDGGGSFAKVPGSTHTSMTSVARTFDGTDFRLVVTGACAPARSSVIGQNAWQASTGDTSSCCPWPIALPDPFNPSTTVFEHCHDNDPANLRYSTNGGVTLNLATWPTSLDTPSLHVHSAHVDPFHGRTFYAVHTNGWTILKSTDGGATYAAVGRLPGQGC